MATENLVVGTSLDNSTAIDRAYFWEQLGLLALSSVGGDGKDVSTLRWRVTEQVSRLHQLSNRESQKRN